MISQWASEKVWMLDQSEEAVVVVESRDVVDVVESWKRAKKKNKEASASWKWSELKLPKHIDETAAGKVAGVPWKLSSNTIGPFPWRQIVHWADVVEASTRSLGA